MVTTALLTVGRLRLGAVALVCFIALVPQLRAVEGCSWTTLNNVARAYDLLPPSGEGRGIALRNPHDNLVFEVGSRKMLFNGVVFYLNSSIIKHGDDWLMALADANDGVGALLVPEQALRGVREDAVMLDPGHGGEDPGTRDGRIEEKRLTLDIARRVRAKLRVCDINACLSRERDATVGLEERCGRAQRFGATLFVSIHLNASRDRRISGVETYVVPSSGFAPTADRENPITKAEQTAYPANRYDAANAVLAYYLHKGLLAYTHGEDRGIRRARFHVIKNVPCPAALVECGFLSNRHESEMLAQDAYRDALAEGISRGIFTYLNRVHEAHLPPVSYP